ncbi:MAG: RluA family pseudouridine synthase [Tannerellaceae bacterium]|nr:RluA family pseudouridine synthase [Tannerellaceae bacterium]
MAQRSDYKRKKYRGNNAPKGRTVTVKESNTLLPFLFQLLNQQSKSSVKALLKHRQISLNGRVATQFDLPVNPGDQVEISYERGKVEFSHSLLQIVYEDDFLLIADKKPGLLSSASKNVTERTAFSMLSAYLKKNDPRSRLFLLNPLDRDTSGLILFARNKGVQQTFLDNWNRMITCRSFIAVVHGKPEKESGILQSNAEGLENEKVVVTSISGRETIMRYNTLRSNGTYSQLEVFQEAGKKNIIKEQMAQMGCPVVGSDTETRNPLGRLGIHAHKLCLKHPETGKEICFESPYPASFKSIVK